MVVIAQYSAGKPESRNDLRPSHHSRISMAWAAVAACGEQQTESLKDGGGSAQFGMVIPEPSFHVLAENRGEGDECVGLIDTDAAGGIVFGGVAQGEPGLMRQLAEMVFARQIGKEEPQNLSPHFRKNDLDD